MPQKNTVEDSRRRERRQRENERNKGYLDRRRQATERADEPEAAKRERLAKAKIIEGFIREIQKRPLVLTEWDEALWLAVVDRVTVGMDGAMAFAFRNELEMTVQHYDLLGLQ